VWRAAVPEPSIHIEATRRFPVTLDRGFEFITDARNWPRYWPGYVRLEPGSAWRAPGDRARLVIRLLGRERELAMRLVELVPNRLVRYTSSQPGLPDATHVREFAADGDGFIYGLSVTYRPRPGLTGLFDRILVARSIRRAFERTLDALDGQFRTVTDRA
jgi:uncharacterized protein YndB with AHSA1/START domain